MKPFEVSRLRLNRAKEHGKSLAKIWNSIPAEYFFEIDAKANPLTGRGEICTVGVGAIPDEFSLLLGEQLYQLRSALDGCTYQAVIYATGKNPPPNESKLEFPICLDLGEFKKQAKRRLTDLPQNLQDGIERIQPYNAPSLTPDEMVKNLNRSLGILNDLARKDRHRKLHVVGAWPYHFRPIFNNLPPGVAVHDLEVMPPGLLGEGSVLATFRLSGYTPGMPISVNPRLSTQLGCNEPPAPISAEDTFDKRLAEMMNTVNSVITAFENYF
jgi:hypothetical protein